MQLKGSIFKSPAKTRDGQPATTIASGNMPRVGDAEKVYHAISISTEKAAKVKPDGTPGMNFHRVNLTLPEGEFSGNVFAGGKPDFYGNVVLYSGSIKIAEEDHRISVTEAKKEGMLYVSIYLPKARPQASSEPTRAEPYSEDPPF